MSEIVNRQIHNMKEQLKRKYPEEELTTIIDYGDFYVLNTRPINGVKYIRNPHAFEKKTGRFFTFNPLSFKNLHGEIIYDRYEYNLR